MPVTPTLDDLEKETGDGYTCEICGIQRPKTWYVYEVERDGAWKKTCCAVCAREGKSNGPFRQNDAPTRPAQPGSGHMETEN